MKFGIISTLIMLCCSGCQSTTEITLTNEYASPIEIIYDSGMSSRIKGKTTKNEYFIGQCFQVLVDGKLLKFDIINIPANFFNTGLFSVQTNGYFTNQMKIRLIEKEDETVFYDLLDCELPKNNLKG